MDRPCKGVRVIKLPTFQDEIRGGCLSFGQCYDHLPFTPKRFFYIYSVPIGCERGAHAHVSLSQCLICLKGSVLISADNGEEKCEHLLNSPSVAIVLDKLIWSTQKYIESDSILLVLASEEFAKEKYINDYTYFKKLVSPITPAQPVKFLDLQPCHTVSKALTESFCRVLESGLYVLGPDVHEFEKEWAAYCDAAYCVGLGSGLDAIYLMLRAAEFDEGSEVIVPANTYIATVLGVTLAGLKPVLVEPNPYTFNIDSTRIEAAITGRTRAILAVDLYGQPADRDSIAKIAQKYKLMIFCDAAQSHGARYKDHVIGGLYDATAFSFYPSKNLGAFGEAGAVVTNDAVLADKLKLLRNYGSRIRYENEVKGINSRLDTLQAAFLRVKLSLLDDSNFKRSEIAAFYLNELSTVPWLEVPLVPDFAKPAWHLFVIKCNERDALRAHLDAHGIPTLIHYPIPPHLSKAYNDMGFREGAFPITENIAKTILSLPIGPHLSLDHAQQVIEAVKSFRS